MQHEEKNTMKTQELICEIGRRMHERQMVAANDGNISVRISDDEIWTTPTGVSKGFMTPDMLVRVNLDGEIIAGNLKPSSEIKMHLRVYRERPDVQAVCHAHPVTATAFAVVGKALDEPFMAENILVLGEVPLAPYATPGSQGVPDSIAPFLADHNAVLLSNHGALTWGDDLIQAYYRMESVEFSARIYLTARQMGLPRLIDGAQLEELVTIREKLGISGAIPRNLAGN